MKKTSSSLSDSQIRTQELGLTTTLGLTLKVRLLIGGAGIRLGRFVSIYNGSKKKKKWNKSKSLMVVVT